MTGKAVAAALKGVVDPKQTVVCTASHAAFRCLESSLGVVTQRFVASRDGHVRDRVYHVQTANQYHGALRSWIQGRLRGVATKYLPHYLAWMRLSTWKGIGVASEDIVASALGRQVINLTTETM